jgi:hypothetical protein
MCRAAADGVAGGLHGIEIIALFQGVIAKIIGKVWWASNGTDWLLEQMGHNGAKVSVDHTSEGATSPNAKPF